MIDPDIGFTSGVILEPTRFVGRHDLLAKTVAALNTSHGLLAVYGKRGVGKSSLARQIQSMALGDYGLLRKAGLSHKIPEHPRKYLTVFYQCDSGIENAEALLSRLINDQDPEDGLLRLVPDDGKEVVEFTRAKGAHAGADLKIVKWGVKGVETTKYAKVVPDDTFQTFRNFISAIVIHQVKKKFKRDALLIILDEFDVIQDKSKIGSLIKSLSSDTVKFCISGIAKDITSLVDDHVSVERLLEDGSLFVRPMPRDEGVAVIEKAQDLYQNKVLFNSVVTDEIVEVSAGYPYFIQLLGKACVKKLDERSTDTVTTNIWSEVKSDIASGAAFPTLESKYQTAIGRSEQRELLLHLLAGQTEEEAEGTDEVGRVYLKNTRRDAADLEIANVDQVLPRLVDRKFGPVLEKVPDRTGVYEFVNPIFRLYIRLRSFDSRAS